MSENNPKADFYSRGYQAAMCCQPDCRKHYTEPFQSSYGAGYDAGQKERKRQGIDFYGAKARVIHDVVTRKAES